MVSIRCTPLSESAICPTLGSPQAAALDIYTSRDQILSYGVGFLHTDISIQYPEGYVALLALRSSTPKKWGLIMPHGMGIIDRDFCGPEDELIIQVWNASTNYCIEIPAGTKIAQLMLVRSDEPRACWVKQELTNESRGGFGSTD